MPAPRQPRFTDGGRPIFENWMDAATRRRINVEWVISHRQIGAPWMGTDDELDRAFVLYAADGRPVLSERGWMSDELKQQLKRTWVEEDRLGGAVFTGTQSQLRYQWYGPPRVLPSGSPRVPRRQLLLGSHKQYVSRVSGTVRVCVRVGVCHGVARIRGGTVCG